MSIQKKLSLFFFIFTTALTAFFILPVYASTAVIGVSADNVIISQDIESIDVSSNSAPVIGVKASNTGYAKLALNGSINAASSSDYAEGLYATGSSGIKVTGLKNITVNAGSDSYGINASSGSSADISMNGDIDVTGGGIGEGIRSSVNSNAKVAGLKNLTVLSNGEACGIDAYYNSNADVYMSGDINVTSNTSKAFGIYSGTSSDITATGLNDLNVSGYGNSYGIEARYNSSADISMNGDIDVSSINGTAIGVYAGNSSYTSVSGLKGLTVGTENGVAYGVYAYNLGDIDLDMSGDITVTSDNNGSYTSGIYSVYGSNVNISGLNNLTVSTDDGYGFGIYAYESTVDAAMNGASNDISVTSNNGTAYGIYAYESDVSVSSSGGSIYAGSTIGNATAVTANDSTVTVSGDVDVIAEGGAYSTAIDASNGSAVTLASSADRLRRIAISSDQDGSSVIKMNGGSTVSFNNAVVTNLGSGDYNSILGYGTNGSGTVNASDSIIYGDVEQRATSGSLALNLLDPSILIGAANVTSGSGSISVNITGAGLGDSNTTDNSSEWYVTGDSDMRGTLTSAGILEFGHEDDLYKSIYAGTLTGDGGLYVMNTDIDNTSGHDTNGSQSDSITAVSGDADGVIYINNDDTNVAAFQTKMDTPLVLIQSGDLDETDFTLKSSQGDDYYELGAWKYDLEKIVNDDGSSGWYMVNSDLSSTAYTIVDSVIMPDIWYLETGALYSQIDKYTPEREEISTWGYAVYNKLRYDNALELKGAAAEAGFSLPGSNEVTNEFKGLTAGIDKRFFSGDKYDFYGGLMFGYGEGDLDMDYGDADDSSLHAGLYGVWRFSSGWYLAGLVKYNRYKTNLTARPYGGGHYDADYTQNGYGTSAIAGKKFVQENGWFWEPQIELGWHRIGDADYTINSLPVGIDSTNSLRGRIGLGFGKNYAYGDGRKLDFFVMASLIHEFDGETDVRIYTDSTKSEFDPFTVDYGGTWGQYKIGFDYDTGKYFNIHTALTYEDGGDRESPIGIELGLNWYIGQKNNDTKKTDEETSKTE